LKQGRQRHLRQLLVVVAVLLLLPAVILLPLRWLPPPFTAYMLRVQLQAWQAGDEGIDYHWVDITHMAPCMPLAVVAAEDQTFPFHRGFAWVGLRDALVDNLNGTGDGLRGASTISQQTAKNLFLWPGRSYVRKAIEGYITLWLELLWPKRRILETYLNIAQFGGRVFGVGAAARRLFGVSAAQLSRNQCAALAAVLPAPDHLNAAAPSAYVRSRIRWIRQQMRQLGSDYLAVIGVAG